MSGPNRKSRTAGQMAGDHPGAALLIGAGLLFFLGYPLPALGLCVFVFAGPALWDMAVDGWYRLRVLVRLGVTAGAGLLAAVALAVPFLLIPAAAGAVVGSGWAAWRWFRQRPHFVEYVQPLHYRLAPLLKLDPETVSPRAWLDVPEELLEAEGGVVVTLPFGWWPKEKERSELVDVVSTTLGLTAVRADWRLKGQDRFVRFTSKATVPTEAMLVNPDIRAVFDRAKESKPLLALAAGDRPIAVDYDAESPHFLLACGTGLGKSALLRLLIMQALHHGSYVVVCDVKRTSQRWCKGLPGVHYARTPEDIHRALLAVQAETLRREELAEDMPPDTVPAWPRVILAVEEMAITQPELVEHWREIREPGDSPTSPAMRAFRRTLLAGRASKVNALVVVQRGDAKELGGGSARAQFATRVVGRHDKPAWKLVMDDAPFVAPDKRRGHVWISLHGDITEAQVVYPTEAEAIEWATSGKESPKSLVATSRSALPPGETVRDGRELVADSQPELERLADAMAQAEAELVTLPEASTDKGSGLVPLTYDSLRAARRRDPEFPEPLPVRRGNAALFDLAAIARWEANRERGGTTTGGTS